MVVRPGTVCVGFSGRGDLETRAVILGRRGEMTLLEEME